MPASPFFSWARGSSAIAAASLCFGSIGCSKSDAAPVIAYGDPVGVKLVDSSSPNGEIVAAFAVTMGHAAEPLTPGVARAVSGALRACPAANALFAKGQVVRIAVRLERSVIVVSPKPTGSPEADCLTAQLAGQRLLDGQEIALDVMFEIGSPHAATP